MPKFGAEKLVTLLLADLIRAQVGRQVGRVRIGKRRFSLGIGQIDEQVAGAPTTGSLLIVNENVRVAANWSPPSTRQESAMAAVGSR